MLTRTFAPALATGLAAVTGTLLWTPGVAAQTPEPVPSTSAPSPSEDSESEAETGGVRILKKDPGGDVMTGAAFTLLDTTGNEAGKGTTNAGGVLAFDDLAPGVYRLKETSSGSPLHGTVPDRDVVITPGITTPVTIVDPFKPATVVLKAKDDKTGQLLAGSTVNIGTGGKTLLTLTTGDKGTATGELPVTSRKAEFWVKQIKAPAGYDLYKPARTFTAGPGAPVTVTVTNAKTSTGSGTPPAPGPSGTPAPGEPDDNENRPTPPGKHSDGDSAAPVTDDPDSSSTSPSPASEGALAHTGASATPWWLAAGGGMLLATGAAAVIATRRRADSSAGG